MAEQTKVGLAEEWLREHPGATVQQAVEANIDKASYYNAKRKINGAPARGIRAQRMAQKAAAHAAKEKTPPRAARAPRGGPGRPRSGGKTAATPDTLSSGFMDMILAGQDAERIKKVIWVLGLRRLEEELAKIVGGLGAK